MWKKVAIACGVLAALAIFIGVVPLKTVAYAVVERYQDTETYTDTERYQDTETYVETERYQDTETYAATEPYQETETYYEKVNQPLPYTVTNSYANSNVSITIGVYVQGFVTVQNTDTVAGTYDVNFSFKTLTRSFNDTVRVYVFPGQIQTARGTADTNVGEDWIWSYTVTPGTKTIDVQKQRTVWRERPVQRQRTVWRERPVQKQRTVWRERPVQKQRTVWRERPVTRYKKVPLFGS